jgi:hypothetical protein
MLSTPNGENASAKVATNANPNAGRRWLRTEKGYKKEKNTKLKMKDTKVTINIVSEPSMLFLAKMRYCLFPYFSPMSAAEASP